MPYGGWSINESPSRAEVLFSFVVSQSSEANFAAEVALVEAAFRKPRQDLTVTLGSTALNSYSHSSGTGYDAEPTILNQVDDPFGSGRSRKYDVRVVVKRPSTNLSNNGRRDTSVGIEYDASNIMTLTLVGTYAGGSSARSNYASNFSAYASTVRTAFSSNFELISKSETTPDTGTSDATPEYHELTFTVKYRELIYSQAGANLNDSGLVGMRMALTKSTPMQNDYPYENVRRPARAQVSWSSNVDKSVTTDLRTKWTSTVLPWLIGQIQTKLGISSIGAAITVNYDYPNNAISATIDAEGIDGGGFLRFTLTNNFETTTGQFLTAVTDGNPFTKYREQGPSTAKLIVEEMAEEFGEKTMSDLNPLGFALPQPSAISFGGVQFGDLRYLLIGRPKTALSLELRGSAPYQYIVSVWSRTTTWELYTEYAGA